MHAIATYARRRAPLVTATLVIEVKPASRRPGISVEGERIEVRVAAPALEGRANAAVRRALAGALGLSQSAIVLTRGAASRRKVFAVDGMERADAVAALRAASEA